MRRLAAAGRRSIRNERKLAGGLSEPTVRERVPLAVRSFDRQHQRLIVFVWSNSLICPAVWSEWRSECSAILRAPAFALRAISRGIAGPRPPRTGDNADAWPPSSRDTGNRLSFAGLRGFAETRDPDFEPGPERNRACNPSLLDAVSVTLGPCPSSRPRSAIPHDARRRRRRAGRTPIDPKRASSAERSRENVSRSGESTARRRADYWPATSMIERTRQGRSLICPGVTSGRRS